LFCCTSTFPSQACTNLDLNCTFISKDRSFWAPPDPHAAPTAFNHFVQAFNQLPGDAHNQVRLRSHLAQLENDIIRSHAYQLELTRNNRSVIEYEGIQSRHAIHGAAPSADRRYLPSEDNDN
jgi:hypothetical protein